ncbi:MAG: GtrA family protein [Phenylobacterium sp.]
MTSRTALAPLLSRFALAGAANTVFGFLVIAGLDLGLGLNPHVANAGGYLAGLILSFQLNKRFVFRAAKPTALAGPRFLVAAGGAFALNQGMLAAALFLFGSGDAARLVGQAAGVATYTIVLFVACRLWVFADSASTSGPPGPAA